MKPIIAFAVALVVGTAGGTGAKVMMTKPAPHTGADSTHAKTDSTQTDSTAGEKKDGEEKKVGETPTDSVHPATANDTSKHVAVVPGAPNLKPPLPTPATAPVAATSDTAVQTAERRLAKVFTSMEAKQAARVLEHMSDGDVHVILGYVGPRQAASILAELPPERVATLSKIAMQKPSGAK